MSVFKKIGKFFLVLFSVLAVIIAIFFALYFFSRKNADEYFDQSFVLYAQAESVRDIYETGLDLSALQAVLEQDEFVPLKNALNNFKSGNLARSPFFRRLLNIETGVQVYGDKSFLAVFDMGLFSLLTRFVPIVNYYLTIDGVDISTLRRGKNTYYEFLLSNGAAYYFSLRDNLLFCSQTVARLEAADATFGSNHALKFSDEVNGLKKKLTDRAHIRFFADTALFEEALPLLRDETVRKVCATGKIAGGSLFLSEEAVSVKLLAPLVSQNEQFTRFLCYEPAGLDIPSWMPAGTSLAASVKAESARSLYDTFLLFQTEAVRQDIAKSLRLLSTVNLTFDQAISWIGNEIGFFYPGTGGDPVVFVKIGNEQAKTTFLKKLTDSIVFKKDDSLVLNSELIRRIALPDFFKHLFASFLKDVNLVQPYYIEENGYMFFSPGAESLLSLSAARRESRFLAADSDFRAVKNTMPGNSGKNSDMVAYYDIRKKLPSFISKKSLAGRLIKLYGNGMVSLRLSEDGVELALALQGTVKSPVEAVVGYPKELGKNIAAASYERDVYMGELKGASQTGPRTVFIDDVGILRVADLSGGLLRSFDVGKGSRAAVYAGKKSWIVVFSRDGTLSVFDGDLQLLPGYPLLLPTCRNSFFPVFDSGRLWLYDAQQSALCSLPVENPQVTFFPWRFEFDIAQPPVFSAQYLVCAPRNLFGEVFLFNADKTPVSGWPVEGGGNFLAGPQIIGGANPSVLFLTQSGTLHLWKADGSSCPGFPLEFSANFTSPPLVFNYEKDRKAVFITDSSGYSRVVSLEGLVLAEGKLDVSAGRDLRFTSCDIDGDGRDEIFLYGSSDRLSAVNAALVPLIGFPLAGNTKPYFFDSDKDGKTEIFTVGLDGKLHSYKLRNAKGR